MHLVQMVSTTPYSLKAVSLKWLHLGNSGQNVSFKERSWGKEILIAQIQLLGQSAVVFYG